MIIDGSTSRKANVLPNLIIQHDIDKISLHVKDLSEPKSECLIKKGEDTETKHFNDSNAFIECSSTMKFMRILMITTQVEKGKF